MITGDSTPPCLQPENVLKNYFEPLIAADVPVYNAFRMFTSIGDLRRISKLLNSIYPVVCCF